MARLRDWVDLGRNTIESLKISDATRFYETEWPETRKMLIADHLAAIEGERKRLKRFVRTRSAILYGLARRLAPLRRVIFFVAFVWFFACLSTLGTREIGVTLIELLTVICVIGILAAFSYPMFAEQAAKGRRAADRGHPHQAHLDHAARSGSEPEMIQFWIKVRSR